MTIGVAGAQIRLAKDFLAEKNDNPDYQKALEDMSSLLLGILEKNLEEKEKYPQFKWVSLEELEK